MDNHKVEIYMIVIVGIITCMVSLSYIPSPFGHPKTYDTYIRDLQWCAKLHKDLSSANVCRMGVTRYYQMYTYDWKKEHKKL